MNTSAATSNGQNQPSTLQEKDLRIAELEHQLEQLNKAYKELDAFATIAAHDLKSPLNAIISLTNLLKNNYGETLDQEGNEYIDFLDHAANNLTAMVSGVLNYSRVANVPLGPAESFNFTDLVEEVTSLLSIPANVSIAYEKSDRQIHTSRVAMLQVLLNLVDNAIRHNDKDKINISISLHDDGDSTILSVKDNGPGIPAALHENLFTLFKKANKNKLREEGMKVGLAIVKRLADRLGGTVSIGSEAPAWGTVITVSLPR